MSTPCNHSGCGCHHAAAQPLPQPFKITIGFLFKLLALVALIAYIVYLFVPLPMLLGKSAGRARALADAHFLLLTLRIYAHDSQGRFPEVPTGSANANANAVYQQLIPYYLNGHKERFYREGSAWTPTPPGSVKAAPGILAPGENHYAYVANLTTKSNPAFPVIADGFAVGTPGRYTREPGKPGYIAPGQAPIVVLVDGSARPMPLGEDLAVREPAGKGSSEGEPSSQRDLFAPAEDWLSPSQVVLNPLEP